MNAAGLLAWNGVDICDAANSHPSSDETENMTNFTALSLTFGAQAEIQLYHSSHHSSAIQRKHPVLLTEVILHHNAHPHTNLVTTQLLEVVANFSNALAITWNRTEGLSSILVLLEIYVDVINVMVTHPQESLNDEPFYTKTMQKKLTSSG